MIRCFKTLVIKKDLYQKSILLYILKKKQVEEEEWNKKTHIKIEK